MAINTKQNIFFAVILTLIVFLILYFVISKSGGSKSTNDYENLKSKIVRPPYNVTCRGLFEQNLVN